MLLREDGQHREQPPHTRVHRQVSLQGAQVRSRAGTPQPLLVTHQPPVSSCTSPARLLPPRLGREPWEVGWTSYVRGQLGICMAWMEVAWARKPATGFVSSCRNHTHQLSQTGGVKDPAASRMLPAGVSPVGETSWACSSLRKWATVGRCCSSPLCSIGFGLSAHLQDCLKSFLP